MRIFMGPNELLAASHQVKEIAYVLREESNKVGGIINPIASVSPPSFARHVSQKVQEWELLNIQVQVAIDFLLQFSEEINATARDMTGDY